MMLVIPPRYCATWRSTTRWRSLGNKHIYQKKKKKKRTVSSFDTRFVTAATAAAAVHKEHYVLITGLRFRDILTRLSFLSDSGGEA